jgi:hypothetical protein
MKSRAFTCQSPPRAARREKRSSWTRWSLWPLEAFYLINENTGMLLYFDLYQKLKIQQALALQQPLQLC